ncbi:unnamed protein product [Triticum turgidum subsp. durum]|uniref:Uncharacterized protein n=1 Tax=Triticum turgidum subsp. durum TaxID=4567 RepID=A0A9R1AAW9_TRITD|nr:unnamed protein product [Triticum turgidum subsp. durum]
MEQLRIFLVDRTMASPPSSTVIEMPQSPHGNAGVPMAPTTPKDAGDVPTMASAATAGLAPTATDKVMSSAANLAQLLPTGTVLAYQALSPSFTNHGKCFSSNRWLTAALVIVLTISCVLFTFTDSVLGRDQKLYYGIATPRGFNIFNFSDEEEKLQWTPAEFRRLRIRPLDFIRAVFTALVFLTVAFSDVGLQNCFFPDAGMNTQELLKNLPLGIAFLSSFVFMIFPTKRKGIGYSDTTPRQKLT